MWGSFDNYYYTNYYYYYYYWDVTPLQDYPFPWGLLPYIADTETCRWTGCGLWPLCPEQGMVALLSLLNMTCKPLSNPRSETFASS